MNQNVLKGIFIVLVIIDHNDFARGVIAPFLKGMGFHVMGFLMIPFLRPAPAWNREFAHYLFRLYYPYFVMVTALSIFVAFLTPVTPAEQVGRWVHSLYSGHSGILKETTHMALLWFLPSFFSLVLLRTWIEHVGGKFKFLAIGVLWVAHPLIGPIAMATRDYLPLGLLPAIYVLPLAYLGIALHRILLQPLGAVSAIGLSAMLFFLIKAIQINFGFDNEIGFVAVADYRDPFELLINDAEAITGVLMVFQISRLRWERLQLGRVLEMIGKYSLQMYLFHAFVALLVYKLTMLAIGETTLLVLFGLSLLTTILLTLPLARFAAKQPLIRRSLFPRSLHELMRPPRVQAIATSQDLKGQESGR